MPYPNEHAARVRDPEEFDEDSFRRKDVEDGVSIVIGKLLDGDGEMVVQAYRFAADTFTAKEAKAWLEEHDVEYQDFEEATGEKSSGLLAAVRARKGGWQICTADGYVRRAIDEYGMIDYEPLVKDAAARLVFCDPRSSSKEAVGGVDLLPNGVEAPPNTLMVVRHVVTTPREDRDMDVLHPEGASLDPKAPLLWQHLHTLPIGKVLATIEKNEKKLRVVSCILDLNDLTGDIAKLVEADCLRFSHGFIAKQWKERGDKPGKASVEDGRGAGFEVTEYEILEVSLVSVPSNSEAEVELWSRGKLASAAMKSHAEKLFRSRSKVFSGIEPAAAEPVAAAPKPSGEPECEKVGRVISSANMNAMQDVVDDIDEVMGMEIPRAAVALLQRCKKRLEDMMESAKPMMEEPSKSPSFGAEDVVAWLMQAGDKEQQGVLRAIISLSKSDRLNRLAEQYRRFTGRNAAAQR